MPISQTIPKKKIVLKFARFFLSLSTAITVFYLTSYSAMVKSRSIESDQLIIKNGVYYSKNTGEPFTGEVSGKESGSLKDGRAEGFWEYYYDDGSIWWLGKYRRGIRIGHWQWFFENGQMSSQGYYEDGIWHGPWVWYHPNGEVRLRGNYENGKAEGRWRYYYDTGRIKEIRNYKNGKRIT